jgi:hypothetical protein
MTDEERQRGKGYRDRFKRRNMAVLCGNTTSDKPNKLRERFKRMYLDEWRILCETKKRNYRHTAHILQRMESHIFIHCVCRRLMDEHPEMPIITIHDCIGTTKEWVARVESVVMEEFAKLGVNPTLDVKLGG